MGAPTSLNALMIVRAICVFLFYGAFPGVLPALSLSSSTPQEQAQFLAGIPLARESILEHLQQTAEYRLHQKELRDQWAFCRSVRYDAMREWGRVHLSSNPASASVLRYLFGGPDFLNAYAFFPNTRIMVLGGLEPVGSVPPPEALDPTTMGAALKSLDEALHTSLFCGYFITSEMKPQFSRGTFQGVLPVLYTELALTGNVILTVQGVHPFDSPGVEITYHRPGGLTQILYYFQSDLSNGGECKKFLDWLREMGPGASYLKAASYLLPLDSFSYTRDFLLKTSDLILQDDSGIPFRDFLSGDWSIQLFGAYTDPLPVFKLRREPELDAAYHSGNYVAKLPFGTGYHVNADSANLLLATRRKLAEASAVTSPMEQAPAAIPAGILEPTPKSTPIRIRKALPIPIRKALPVPIRKAIPCATPKLIPPTTTLHSGSVPLNPPFQNLEPLPNSVENPTSNPSPVAIPTTTSGKPVD